MKTRTLCLTALILTALAVTGCDSLAGSPDPAPVTVNVYVGDDNGPKDDHSTSTDNSEHNPNLGQ